MPQTLSQYLWKNQSLWLTSISEPLIIPKYWLSNHTLSYWVFDIFLWMIKIFFPVILVALNQKLNPNYLVHFYWKQKSHLLEFIYLNVLGNYLWVCINLLNAQNNHMKKIRQRFKWLKQCHIAS